MYNILCVDDTSANLLVLESLFEYCEQKYNIVTALSGHDALGVLLNQKIDLILLDVMMPDLDGFETAQLIKENKLTKNIPIIFLTAKKDDITIKNAFKYGVDYLSKPYDEFELFTRVAVQLKLVESQKQLDEQILFNQSILDSQHNILFIQDDKGIINANKSFFKFFNIYDVDEFNKKYKCISELFMEYENYFSLHVLNPGEFWASTLSSEDEDREYNILIMDTIIFEPRAFKIDVSGLENSDRFVVSLTDVTTLTTKSKQFENKATYDALTNIFNRSKFNEVFDLEVKLAVADNHSLSFAIMDIDFFKKVNDNYGHIIGDETLITFAQTIEHKVRKSDTFARWGGEEFVLALPGTNVDTAFKVVDGLRKEIEKTSFEEIGSITCSIGLTQLRTNDTIDDILIRSDEALYEAKETGRNKVCIK